ncbi:Drug resistance transporter Bcr/CflA subfamily [gut metagenome]|uniref:Drug resistance transporter Bcr/CflA subfamily n=1 Tax=gut metagenome TaxID=749906 RepID=J9D4V2_9ZZZZ
MKHLNSSQPNQPPTFGEAAAIAFCSCLGPFAISAYMPGFPAIAEEFGTSVVMVQQSLSFYLIPFACGSLIVGALSDVFGRRPVFVLGMLLFMLASAGAGLSESLNSLYFWRILQGLGASVGPVITQAIVRDCWNGLNATKMTGLIAIFFAIAPAISPVLGGQIFLWGGWRAVFGFLMLFAAGIIATVFLKLGETLPREKRQRLDLKAMGKGYALGLKHKAFMAGVIAHGTCFMGGIIYSAGSSDIVMNILGYGAGDFAWLTFPLIASGMIGSYLATAAQMRFGSKMIPVTLLLMTFCCAICMVVSAYCPVSYLLLLIGPVIYQFGMGLTRPVIIVMNLDYFPTRRGMAASVQQFMHTAFFAVCTVLWLPVVYGVIWKYVAVMTLSAALTWWLWRLSMKARQTIMPE